MTKDKIKYILGYHSELMTEDEKKAWRHLSSVFKMQDSTPSQKESRTRLSLKNGWMTADPKILKLLENGIDEFRKNVATRIANSHIIDYNNCPNCKKIARTPKAKQCRFCLFDWH